MGMGEAATLTALDWLSGVRELEQRGEYVSAYDAAGRGLEHFPDDLWLKHRAVLALARSGASERARLLFHDLGLEGRDEEDIAALGARLAKDLALRLDGTERAERAAEAARLYEGIFARTGGYYPGINAATTWLLAGDPERGASLARQAIEACRRSAAAGDSSYWLKATEAEAALVLGDVETARRVLAEAARLAGTDYAALASTRRQLRRVCSAREVPTDVLDALKVPSVIHFCGHMIAPPGEAGRFPAELESMVAGRIAARLEAANVGFGYGSLACGADILFAEQLLERGAEVHIVLPFDVEEFKTISVARGGPGWPKRFDACLARAASVTYATEDAFLGNEFLFGYASRLSMGLAILRARNLDTAVEQEAVWDGQPATSLAGTAVDVAFWRECGFPQVLLSVEAPPAKPTRPAPSVFASPAPRVVRALLFGDMKGYSRLRDGQILNYVTHVLNRVAGVLDDYGEDILFRNTWGDGLYIVASDAPVAARCALELQKMVAGLDLAAMGLPANFGLRLAGHLGPVFPLNDDVLGLPSFFGSHVSRTARVEPVTPEGHVYVTEPFAARLALDKGSPFSCEYVGHMPAAKGYGNLRMYLLRET